MVDVTDISSETALKLRELIDLFKRNQKQYTSSSYNEANTRVDFIDKFFELLGWDVRNERGYAEGYRDVVREDTVTIKGKPRAPDYSFRIGGARKFFVEAKKPTVNIKEDADPAFQVRRYGYTAKVPLSILTDFEEFAVYDTRIQPHQNDAASSARIFYCKYDQYEEHFDFLCHTFSKDAIHKGSFDAYIVDQKGKKGTSEVDKDFLLLIETWRNDLAKNVALRNSALSIYELNYAVQKIIDRIIFLRIAEDRQVEEYGALKGASANLYTHLNALFKRADHKYNSGLFRQEQFFDALVIDDKVLKSIVQNLYYPDCPYEFSVFSTEILGNIYEQFLGKTIRLTAAHQAKVEEKPEVKKAGGVYYTPQYIVDYIVQHTVGQCIKNKTPAQIEKIRIVDPACGSGSFLLGAYRYLLDWHLNYYQEGERRHNALIKNAIYQRTDSEYALTIRKKQEILLRNIFGVDIDSQAIEVTKLSLLLKLMEGENQESADSFFKHSDLQLLPDLSANIKCGNSLIGSDFYRGQNMSLFGEEEMRQINVFDWAQEFKEIMEDGGFDVVVGNPPYIQLQKLKGEHYHSALQQAGYKTYHATGDIYCLFYEKGYDVLKTNGVLGFITSNKWMRAGYGEKMRNFLLEKTAIKQIIDFKGSKIFQHATVDTHIVTYQKRKVEKQQAIGYTPRNFALSAIDIAHQIKKHSFKLAHDKDIFLMINHEEKKIKEKIEKVGIPLKKWEVNINFGIKTGYNDAFIIDTAKRDELIAQDPRSEEIIKPILRGRDIKRYQENWAGLYVILAKYGSHKYLEQKYPAVFEHLSRYKDTLQKRGQCRYGGKGNQGQHHWLELDNNPSNEYLAEFEKEKIVWKRVGSIIRFSFNDEKHCCLDSTCIMTGENIKYLTALLNSKTGNYLLQDSPRTGTGDLLLSVQALNPIFIPPITPQNRSLAARIEVLADDIRATQAKYYSIKTEQDKNLHKRKIDILDAQIDRLVYELYDLSVEEIEIVEGKATDS